MLLDPKYRGIGIVEGWKFLEKPIHGGPQKTGMGRLSIINRKGTLIRDSRVLIQLKHAICYIFQDNHISTSASLFLNNTGDEDIS